MSDKAEFEVELEDDVTPNARRAEGALDRLHRGLERFNRTSMGRAVQRFAAWGKNMIVLGAAATAAVGAGVVAMTVGMADFGQRSRSALGILLHSSEAGEAAFQRMRGLAERLGLDVKDTMASFQKLLSVGFDEGQAETLVKMGADMMALGNSSEKVQSILDAMGKIKATGSLQGDELMMLAEAGFDVGAVYKRLGKMLGKTPEQIVKMKEAGKIGAKDAIKAIQGVVLDTLGKKQFGDAAADVAANTLTGMVASIKARIQNAFIDIGDGIGPKIMEAFKALRSAFENAFADPNMKSDMVTTLGNVATAVKALAEPMAKVAKWTAKAALGMLELGANIVDFLGPGERAHPILDKIAAALQMAGLGAGIYTIALIAMNPALLTVIPSLFAAGAAGFMAALPMILLGAAVFAVGAAVWLLIDQWQKLMKELGDASLWSVLKNMGSDLMSGMANGITAGAQWVWDALRNMATGGAKIVKSIFQIGSPSKLFEGFGQNLGQGMQLGVDSERSGVHKAIGRMADPEAGRAPIRSALSDMSAVSSGRGGAGATINFSPTINVTAGPGATREDAERLGKDIRAVIRRELGGLLENAALEAGV